MPVREIILAYAVDLGLDVEKTNSELVTRMPDSTDKLSKEMVEAILTLIRTAVEEKSFHKPEGALKENKEQLVLAADSSSSTGKENVDDLEALGEEPQLARQRWRRK
ncbi:hypothetical protein [Psychromicrobium lacuslunae]|uniref:hypothetical protein n=1 Tax=Psychromicrobium lacuslunae TaxID=1618207 RepID=UPI0018FF87F1|nr:hypothetical protein [Psychromicrobium lacuslunae]